MFIPGKFVVETSRRLLRLPEPPDIERLAAAMHGPRRRADHEGRVLRSIGRSPARDRAERSSGRHVRASHPWRARQGRHRYRDRSIFPGCRP